LTLNKSSAKLFSVIKKKKKGD